MDLTEENVSKLPSDGSFFSSYFPPSISIDSTEIPHAVRLQRAKESVEVHMRGFYRLGEEGRQILHEDELYVAGRGDVRFRKSEDHKKDMDNLDYWEAKAHHLEEKYNALYDEKHPPMPFIIDPENPEVIRQAEIDRMHFRAERRKRRVEAWVSSISQQEQEYPRIVDSSISRYTEPWSHVMTPTDSRQPTIPRPSSPSEDSADMAIPPAEAPPIRPSKRKRSDLQDEHEKNDPSSKRSVQGNLSRETPSTIIIDPPRELPGEPPKKKRAARKIDSTTTPSRPVPLRRSARIAALPKIKYPK